MRMVFAFAGSKETGALLGVGGWQAVGTRNGDRGGSFRLCRLSDIFG